MNLLEGLLCRPTRTKSLYSYFNSKRLVLVQKARPEPTCRPRRAEEGGIQAGPMTIVLRRRGGRGNLSIYIVRHDRPFTEIITADYIMVSPHTARGSTAVSKRSRQIKGPGRSVRIRSGDEDARRFNRKQQAIPNRNRRRFLSACGFC